MSSTWGFSGTCIVILPDREHSAMHGASLDVSVAVEALVFEPVYCMGVHIPPLVPRLSPGTADEE